MKRIFSVFLVGIFLGGCASSRYLESSTHTQVEIKQGNFRMIKPNVQAASSGFSLFGILPLTAPSSTTAWSRLNKNAGIALKSNHTPTIAKNLTSPNPSIARPRREL